MTGSAGLRRAILAALLASGVACAGLRPAAVETADLAGSWRGRMQAASGHAVVSLAIAGNGSYRGVMHLDDGDREFHGAIMPAPFGAPRYRGPDGAGTVTVEGRGPDRVLRLRPDAGGPGGEFRPVP